MGEARLLLPAENDRMEGLLFRFVTAHSALWEITAAYQNMQNPFNDPVLDANAYVLLQSGESAPGEPLRLRRGGVRR